MADNDKPLSPETPGGAEEAAGEEPPIAPGTGEPEGFAPAREEDEELARVRTQLAYLAAEFDNFRKRAAREKETIVSYANERLLLAILPFLDNLERAIAHAGAAGADSALLSGIRLTYDQFLSELRRFGLAQISAEGAMFDPNLHEAIATVPWEGKPEGTVVAESRKGYLLNGRLLRPAQVAVAAAPPAGAAAEGNGPDRGGRGN